MNPASNEIVWKYQEASADNFYSSRISNAQRLPNGNTLINEGLFGRLFEVAHREDGIVFGSGAIRSNFEGKGGSPYRAPTRLPEG